MNLPTKQVHLAVKLRRAANGPATCTASLQVRQHGKTITRTRLRFGQAGARWDFQLKYASMSGCGLYPTRSASQRRAAFGPDGAFVLNGSSFSHDPWANWRSDPPGQQVTHEVRADRTLLLACANGTQQVYTLGIYPAKDGSYPANPAEGIVLDGQGYFDFR
jgi:hypothetical protein